MIQKLLSCWTLFFFYPIFMYSKSAFLALDKTKIQVCIWGYFCTFTRVFSNYQGHRGFGSFHIDFFYLLIRKVVVACSVCIDKWMASASFKQ